MASKATRQNSKVKGQLAGADIVLKESSAFIVVYNEDFKAIFPLTSLFSAPRFPLRSTPGCGT
jgi:hypothetical protein